MLSLLLSRMSEEERNRLEYEREQRQNDPMRRSFNVLNQFARDQADNYAQTNPVATTQTSIENTTSRNKL